MLCSFFLFCQFLLCVSANINSDMLKETKLSTVICGIPIDARGSVRNKRISVDSVKAVVSPIDIMGARIISGCYRDRRNAELQKLSHRAATCVYLIYVVQVPVSHDEKVVGILQRICEQQRSKIYLQGAEDRKHP